ncbi:hypothetical protein [Paeniglutamicibacter terrestris]|uniref:MFS transporter n=1 Tax=Paeniglutamicibacter terrestris TaxID=2723403 RepID=A0ABX1G0N7_9MICC|nr:hypothetical protein [Paeniglutamicibacter terrestris]NKG19780.1 hypothetical protein [Paeniglutamicibacter terrestris]
MLKHLRATFRCKVIPATQRGGTLSSVYLVSYVAFGGPTLVAGLLIPTIGLQNMVYGYAAFIVVLSVIALLLLLRSRTKRIKSSTAAGQ